MTRDIVEWLRDEERGLREREGAVHWRPPQYQDASWEIERLRALVAAASKALPVFPNP
jgi:hypothetical protein